MKSGENDPVPARSGIYPVEYFKGGDAVPIVTAITISQNDKMDEGFFT